MTVDNTFKPNALVNTRGIATINGQQLPIEMYTSDPTLVSGVPQVWVNLLTNKMKASLDGIAKYSVPLYVDTGTALAVEFLSSDPALVSGTERIWISTATGDFKYTPDGILTYIVTSTSSS